MRRFLYQFSIYFWTIDPGYFNFKHAAKTILAILVSLLLVRDGGSLVIVTASIVSGASMQVVIARSMLSRIVQVVIFDVMYFVALALGFGLRGYPYWTAASLVILGFVVNYIRRFGLDNSKAPLMAWVLCFIATILPFTDTVYVWDLAHAVIVGFLVSATVLIFVFPENYPYLFVNNSNRFFDGLAQGLLEMRRYALVGTKEEEVFANLPFVLIQNTLNQLLESNQTLQQSTVFGPEEKQISYVLIHQFGLLNAYSLIVDTYYSLWVCKHQLSRPGVLALSHVSRDFARLYAATKVGADYRVSVEDSKFILPKLAELLGNIRLIEPEMIMALLNFKLSFDLLSHYEKKLLQGVNDA